MRGSRHQPVITGKYGERFMTSKKRTPGAGGARGSKKHSKKSQNRTRKRKRAQRFAPRRAYWLYDGQTLLGTMFVKYTGETLVFDATRRPVGVYPTQKAAAAAIGASKFADAARNRLFGPVAFASGLPSHFLGISA
jgi:hypothetical protein